MDYATKLKNFPSVNYPSLHECTARRAFMQHQFAKYGIYKINCFLTDRFDAIKHNYTIHHSVEIEKAQPGIVLSYLTLVKNWYDKNEEECAIFCDDDANLSSIEHWSFTWDEFISNLPQDWECIQLIRINEWYYNFFKYGRREVPELRIREREWDDWGSCFLLNRAYAKKLLDRHWISETEINLDVPDGDWGFLYSVIENVLFRGLGKVYSFPMLFEEIELGSTFNRDDRFHPAVHVDEHVRRIASREYYKTLWETQGSILSIRNIMNRNVFAGLPSINFISLEESTDRREYMAKQLDQYDIPFRNIFLAKRFDDHKDEFKYSGEYVHGMDGGGIGAVTSHLSNIRHWYHSTNDDYALFTEDDINLSSCHHWNFKWLDFVNNLPSDWAAVQLIRIHEFPNVLDPEQLKIRDRHWDDWGATYLLKRETAKILLDRYIHGDEFVLNAPGGLIPCIENVLFTDVGKIYNCPLFYGETSLPTTFIPYFETVSDFGYDHSTKLKHNHYESSMYYSLLWKRHGRTLSIENIMRKQYV